jgi:AcrR family transcriptional regulator
MMSEGSSLPSVAEVAAVADVSRRTAYRYFPTAEQLATEAVLETLGPQLAPTVEEASGGGDASARVAATVRHMQQGAVANERLLRAMIRLTIDRQPPTEGGHHPGSRGSRRVRWLNDAIAPLRTSLSRRAYERLLSALCLCVGAEALIALRDARGLGTDETIEVCVWAAGTLVEAATREPATTPRRRRMSSKRAPRVAVGPSVKKTDVPVRKTRE